MDINIHLGQVIRKRRRMLGLTQVDLAEQLGVRFQTVQKYECAASKLSASRLWELSQALEMSVSEFFAGLKKEMNA